MERAYIGSVYIDSVYTGLVYIDSDWKRDIRVITGSN